MNIMEWLQQWYLQNCDGDWEHCHGIKISTLDNPGWMVSIALSDTNLEEQQFEVIDIERSDSDWIYCKVKDSKFEGFGGTQNLLEIINIFYEWTKNVEKN